MNEDELHHRHTALEAGGVELPYAVKITMTAISKLMTKRVIIFKNKGLISNRSILFKYIILIHDHI